MRSSVVTLLAACVGLVASHPVPDDAPALQHQDNDTFSISAPSNHIANSDPSSNRPITLATSLQKRDLTMSGTCGARKHYVDVYKFSEHVNDFCDLFSKLKDRTNRQKPQFKDYQISETNQEHPGTPGKQIWLTLSIQPLQEKLGPLSDAIDDCRGWFVGLSGQCYGFANHDTRGGKGEVGHVMYGAQMHETQKADWKLPNPGHYWDAAGKKHGWNGASATKEELH